MSSIDDCMGLPNSAIEDNPNVFPWRYDFAKLITKTIYNRWTNNKKLNYLYVTQKNKYIYRTFTNYCDGNHIKLKYWTVYSYQYFYHC